MNIAYIIIPVIVGLVCGFLGYILGKRNTKSDDLLTAALQADLDACKANSKNLNIRITTLEKDLLHVNRKETQKITEPVLFFDSSMAANVCGKTIIENDFKIVEGIGPKVESLLKDAGIKTWKDLSEADTEKLQSVLELGGENYAIHNPSTWTKQALFAYEGKWPELKDWQENLRGGKE